MNKKELVKDDPNVVIRLDNMSKAYGLPYALSFKRCLNFFRQGLKAFHRDDMTLVLKDLSLEVRRGELLGVIGRNGAGKSTMLKVVSGVSKPNAGKVTVRGRIFPMIELNAGMNPRFTGRENIYLLATIMNIPRKVIEARMDDIEEFCDLGKFFDRPVREYSSGMPGRLGFAVAVHADADIVLIDEVLSVGDVNFRNRCTAKMEELRDSGKTLVLVSHNMSAISALCSRTVVLDGGDVRFNGPTAAAVQFYGDLMQSIALRKLQKTYRRNVEKTKSGLCDVWGLNITNGRGEEMPIIDPRKALNVSYNVKAAKGFEEGLAFIRIEDTEGVKLVDESWLVHLSVREVGRRLTFEFPRGIPFKTGQHKLTVGILDKFGDILLASTETPIAVSANTKGGRGAIAPRFKLHVTTIPDLTSKKNELQPTD